MEVDVHRVEEIEIRKHSAGIAMWLSIKVKSASDESIEFILFGRDGKFPEVKDLSK